MDYQDFRNKLFENAEEGYRDFVLGGIITERPLLGVRIPKCRELAEEIIAAGEVREFLAAEPVSFEEVMVRGLVVAKLPYPEMVAEMYKFISLIDNWEVCDCFCGEMGKNIKKHRGEFLEEIDKMLRSLDEFETRVGLVCLLLFYVEADYLAVVFDRVAEIAEFLGEGPGEMSVVRARKDGLKRNSKRSGESAGHLGEELDGLENEGVNSKVGVRVAEKVLSWDAHYVKVAVAWLIATCFAKFPEETMAFFKQVRLPKWTFNKAILKTCESKRVDKEVKEELRGLKRKREKIVV